MLKIGYGCPDEMNQRIHPTCPVASKAFHVTYVGCQNAVIRAKKEILYKALCFNYSKCKIIIRKIHKEKTYEIYNTTSIRSIRHYRP